MEAPRNFIATMFIFRDAKFRHWREIDIEVTGIAAMSRQKLPRLRTVR